MWLGSIKAFINPSLLEQSPDNNLQSDHVPQRVSFGICNQRDAAAETC